jgi:cytochrome b6-f complex iron-sulfur subunit
MIGALQIRIASVLPQQTTRSSMADEKDAPPPGQPAAAGPEAKPQPVETPSTAPPDHAPAAHPAGTEAASAPPTPTPPMTAPPGQSPEAAPAPRSNAASGVTEAAPARPEGVAPAEPTVPAGAPAPVKPATPAAADKPAAPAAAPAAAAKPATPAPPAATAQPERVSRRGFLKWTTVGWVAFSAACTSSLVATTRFLFPNVLFEPPQAFKAGFPSEYNVGEVDTRWKDAFSVWIVREPDQFYAIIAVCTHLGCSPNWLAAENKFKCPCHGSGFYRTGVNFEGPAPRPLERARIVLADDGQILVDKSVKFQQEKGEWTKDESFLKA